MVPVFRIFSRCSADRWLILCAPKYPPCPFLSFALHTFSVSPGLRGHFSALSKFLSVSPCLRGHSLRSSISFPCLSAFLWPPSAPTKFLFVSQYLRGHSLRPQNSSPCPSASVAILYVLQFPFRASVFLWPPSAALKFLSVAPCLRGLPLRPQQRCPAFLKAGHCNLLLLSVVLIDSPIEIYYSFQSPGKP
jgi:hypothetical protein